MAFKLGKFLVEILCFARHPLGGDDLHTDQEITMFTAPLHTLPLRSGAQYCTGCRPGL